MDRNPKLGRAFVIKAKEILSKQKNIKHEWSIDEHEDHCILYIPEADDAGFPITIKVGPGNILIIAGGAHTHLYLENDNYDEIVINCLGLVRDLLSPGMRVREKLSGGIPYKWAIENLRNGEWIAEEWNGLFFWNYFGKRTEKIYINNLLPARTYPV